ncbi:adenylate/guanylate cyclase domain-containing protein [Agromyces protaetiae]|uniref:Adenylate/guanylate cyclase domain-containing protein n=1 Tax=Agromyces protaetiae TaxID=2509455 RepID=A0A4P6FAW5_9MICO|nr:adenylate/guanylate cyclase domain-containing protein [Agromyces protaetiae]QAY72103.1 adenylate/guanylate cyclase domain-containing protein [Agromyces protaetiae]
MGDRRTVDASPGQTGPARRSTGAPETSGPSETALPPETSVSPEPAPTPRRRRRPGLSIQSRLLVILLVTTLLSALVVGVIGWISGRDSLRAAAYSELTTIRELRSDDLTRTLGEFVAGVRVASANASAELASVEFNAAFAALDEQPVSAEDDARLIDWYETSFLPKLAEHSDDVFDARSLLPPGNAGRHLQLAYTVPTDPYEDQDAASAVEDAGDGTAWSAVHARFHDYFTRLVDNFGYVDVLLVDDRGNVVYTADKGIDLGADLLRGPYERTALADAYREAMASGSASTVATTDFEPYVPSLEEPTAWAVAPVGDAGDLTGALAVQVPISTIDAVLTGGGGWKEQGLGETGEVYLVGADGLMRSNSRPLIEDPSGYADRVVAHGTPRSVADEVVARGSTVLLQPASSPAVDAARGGGTGVMVSREYIGAESLTAFAPFETGGLDWVVVARMDTAEAFAPVDAFTRTLVLATLGIMLLASLAALVIAQAFTRPIRKLGDAVGQVAAGDLDVRVATPRRDEFGDLGTAFNDMAKSLRVKQDLIDEQKAEYDRLLLTLMPASVAKRYRKGEDGIAEEHQDVSVVYADLLGFDEFADALGGQESVMQLGQLVKSFDDAAERIGVEKVRPLREGYLASSGLMVPRIDNVRRAVDFALELRDVVERFNAQHDSRLAMRIGVATGTVTAGVVGRTSLAFDLWGEAVNLAHLVRTVTGDAGIFVSEGVRDGVGEAIAFEEVGSVEAKDGRQTVWKVV